MKKLPLIIALLISTASPAQATVVVEERGGTAVASGSFYWGVSFTTPTGSPWDDITINFYDAVNNNLASGTGYLFTSAYLGSATGLSSAGALAASTTTTNSWNFASSFQLLPTTQYYFYSDALLAPLLGNNVAAGESYFFNSSAFGNFTQVTGNNINFTVNTTIPAVPEPATWAMMLLGFGGIGYSMRRRRKTSTGAQFA